MPLCSVSCTDKKNFHKAGAAELSSVTKPTKFGDSCCSLEASSRRPEGCLGSVVSPKTRRWCALFTRKRCNSQRRGNISASENVRTSRICGKGYALHRLGLWAHSDGGLLPKMSGNQCRVLYTTCGRVEGYHWEETARKARVWRQFPPGQGALPHAVFWKQSKSPDPTP